MDVYVEVGWVGLGKPLSLWLLQGCVYSSLGEDLPSSSINLLFILNFFFLFLIVYFLHNMIFNNAKYAMQ